METQRKLTSTGWFWMSVVLGLIVVVVLARNWLDGQRQKGYDEMMAKYIKTLEAPESVVSACRSAASGKEAINRTWANVREAYNKEVPAQDVMDGILPLCVDNGYSEADCSTCLTAMINEAYR